MPQGKQKPPSMIHQDYLESQVGPAILSGAVNARRNPSVAIIREAAERRLVSDELAAVVN